MCSEAQNKEFVRFNSRWTVLKTSASSSSALVPVLNYKIFGSFMNNNAEQLPLGIISLFVGCYTIKKGNFYFIHFISVSC